MFIFFIYFRAEIIPKCTWQIREAVEANCSMETLKLMTEKFKERDGYLDYALFWTYNHTYKDPDKHAQILLDLGFIPTESDISVAKKLNCSSETIQLMTQKMHSASR